MMASLYTQLKNSSIRYDEDKVKNCLIVIRNSKNDKLVEKSKMLIYNSLSNIIVKNVNNFFNLIKRVEAHRVLHERDDIVTECYVILNKCIKNFDVNSGKNFFFYFNKALSLGLHRLAKKNYKDDIYFNDYDVVHKFETNTFSNVALDPVMLDNVKFTLEHTEYIDSRLADEKINDFISRKGITRTAYYKIVNEVKSILSHIYERNDSVNS